MNQTNLPDKKVASIVKALAMVENGGKIPLDNPSQGQSGEMKSIFQFTPGTWKMYSKEILGQEVPMDKGSESLVTYGKVQKWLEQGLEPEEIASIWNSGKPDAYKQNHVGVNKFGVKYDTPGYVKKFSKYLSQSGEQTAQAPAQAPTTKPQLAQAQAQPQAQTQTLPQMAQGNMMKQSSMKQPRQI